MGPLSPACLCRLCAAAAVALCLQGCGGGPTGATALSKSESAVEDPAPLLLQRAKEEERQEQEAMEERAQVTAPPGAAATTLAAGGDGPGAAAAAAAPEGVAAQTTAAKPKPTPRPAPTPAPMPAYCSAIQEDCRNTKCCLDPEKRCYEKNQWWAECLNKSSCTPGLRKEDPIQFRSNWSCAEISGPTQPPFHGWTLGTWTTGYWDCCKPSCAWPHKGSQTRPVRSCHARTGKWVENASEISVCNGGVAASCTGSRPFVVNDGLSMGFAAAAVSGGKHLTGDMNCGQCYELVFEGEQHLGLRGGTWGGSSPGLAGKRMIVQVTNIGNDIDGNHSFDLQIPGAGLGGMEEGCLAQFPGHSKDDFDCGERFGGCSKRSECSRLPLELQAGCLWRFDWFEWLREGGRTNNPYVRFRRVKCPLQLTEISGSVPLDDEDDWLIVM